MDGSGGLRGLRASVQISRDLLVPRNACISADSNGSAALARDAGTMARSSNSTHRFFAGPHLERATQLWRIGISTGSLQTGCGEPVLWLCAHHHGGRVLSELADRATFLCPRARSSAGSELTDVVVL